MVGMAKRLSIALSPTTATTLRKPIRGRGQFQSLLRRLQGQLDGRHLDVSPVDVERLRRYSAAYGAAVDQLRWASRFRLDSARSGGSSRCAAEIAQRHGPRSATKAVELLAVHLKRVASSRLPAEHHMKDVIEVGQIHAVRHGDQPDHHRVYIAKHRTENQALERCGRHAGSLRPPPPLCCTPSPPSTAFSQQPTGNRRLTPNVADCLRQEWLAACVS
jgi:hypothetical protein